MITFLSQLIYELGNCNTQGWYWPAVGPQMTMYIPGPFLVEGQNELILLELEGAPAKPTGTSSVITSTY